MTQKIIQDLKDFPEHSTALADLTPPPFPGLLSTGLLPRNAGVLTHVASFPQLDLTGAHLLLSGEGRGLFTVFDPLFNEFADRQELISVLHVRLQGPETHVPEYLLSFVPEEGGRLIDGHIVEPFTVLNPPDAVDEVMGHTKKEFGVNLQVLVPADDSRFEAVMPLTRDKVSQTRFVIDTIEVRDIDFYGRHLKLHALFLSPDPSRIVLL